MAANVSPQPLAVGEQNSNPNEVIPNINNTVTYAAWLNHKQSTASLPKTSLKPFEIVHGVPTIQFSMDEREEFAKEEGLHQAVMIKLSSGAPNLQILRSILPKIFGIKGNFLLGLLAPGQFLIRCDQHEDYVACLARAVNYFQHNEREHQYRVFPWSVGYNPKDETSKVAVWISLPNLSPELFARKPLLSIAAAVGKPIAIDKATQFRSRPSTARVKVIIDLLDKLHERIRLQYLDVKSGKIVEDYQEIIYDNLPSYCCHCKHQGHEENECRHLKGKAVQAARVYDETVENEHQIGGKLQGDARDFFNSKRARTQLIEGSESDNNTMQQVCDDLSKGADATSVRDVVQVENTGGSKGPVVPDRDMNSKGEAAGNLEAGKSGKGSDQVEHQNTNLNSTVPVSDPVPTATALSRLHKAVNSDLPKLDGSGTVTVAGCDRREIATGEVVDKSAAFEDIVGDDKGQEQVRVMALGCAATTVSKAVNIEAIHHQVAAGGEQAALGALKPSVAFNETMDCDSYPVSDRGSYGGEEANNVQVFGTKVSSKKSTPNSKKLQLIERGTLGARNNSNHFAALGKVNDDDGKIAGENLQLVDVGLNTSNQDIPSNDAISFSEESVHPTRSREALSKSWADHAEEEEGKEADSADSYRATDKENSSPNSAQTVNTLRSKASTGKKKKLQQVQHAETVKVHDEQTPIAPDFVPSKQQQIVAAMEGVSSTLQADKEIAKSGQQHALNAVKQPLVTLSNKFTCSNLKREQENGLKLRLQFASHRVERVIKDELQMLYFENTLTEKLKNKLETPDFIPSKPPCRTCIHHLDTPPNTMEEYIGTSKAGAIWMKSQQSPTRKQLLGDLQLELPNKSRLPQHHQRGPIIQKINDDV